MFYFFLSRLIIVKNNSIASTGEQVVIRTCTMTKLLETDSSYSSFTLKIDEQTELNIVSGLIASCRDDGCNSVYLNKANKIVIIFSSIILFKIFK